jgi:hypothetical protein
MECRWLLIAVCCLAVLVSLSDARRNSATGRANGADCSAWSYAECVAKNTQTGCGKGTKQGTRTGETCQLTEKSFPCRVKCDNAKTACQYKPSRQAAQAALCDTVTGKKTITLPLTRGDPATCAPTKVIQKNCNTGQGGHGQWAQGQGAQGQEVLGRGVQGQGQQGGRANRGRPAREARVGSRRDRRPEAAGTTLTPGVVDGSVAGSAGSRQQRCKYTKGPWSQCDTTTTRRSRTLTLKANSPASCQQTKTITKKCRNSGRSGETTGTGTAGTKPGRRRPQNQK